ncbi:MAG: hypothetical protein FWE90_00595 [Defluviitaleaceae bacterium]|nr:hypothetical protein [Defluviitaleaceae bacterium]
MSSIAKRTWLCACGVKNDGALRNCANCDLEKQRLLSIVPGAETTEEQTIPSVPPPISIPTPIPQTPPQANPVQLVQPYASSPAYTPPPSPYAVPSPNPQYIHVAQPHVKSKVGRNIFLFLLVAVAALLGMSALGVFCIGETLGITPDCGNPICRNSSTIFTNFCSRCGDAIQRIDGIFR